MASIEIINALEACRDESGLLRPDAVVEAAASPGSPLHDLFEWDEATAAHEFRVDQARRLIRSVKIELVIGNVSVRSVRYVRDPDVPKRDQGYIRTDTVEKGSLTATEIVRSELLTAEAALRRAEVFGLTMDVTREIADLAQAIRDLRERLEQPEAV